MQIATSKTREQFPLSYRKIMKKTIASSLVWVFLLLMFGGVALGVAVQSRNGLGIVAVMISFVISVLVICMLAFLYQRWYYAVYFYDLTDNYIIIRKGPITPTEITIPFERIQDVYVSQDLLDRMFGLFDVHISSATSTSGIEAHIDGVEQKAAEGLKDLILQSVRQKINK